MRWKSRCTGNQTRGSRRVGCAGGRGKSSPSRRPGELAVNCRKGREELFSERGVLNDSAADPRHCGSAGSCPVSACDRNGTNRARGGRPVRLPARAYAGSAARPRRRRSQSRDSPRQARGSRCRYSRSSKNLQPCSLLTPVVSAQGCRVLQLGLRPLHDGLHRRNWVENSSRKGHFVGSAMNVHR